MKIIWSPLAQRDLSLAYDFIRRDNAIAAARAVETILSSVERPARFPESGRPGQVEGTRELVIAGTPFLVPYRVLSDAVNIVAVVHSARRWPQSDD